MKSDFSQHVAGRVAVCRPDAEGSRLPDRRDLRNHLRRLLVALLAPVGAQRKVAKPKVHKPR